MKLWLDDVRPAPEGYTWVKTVGHAIMYIVSDKFTHISFDHDLGKELTGYDLAKWIEKNADDIKPMTWDVHSANPVGRKNIEAAMCGAEKRWILNYCEEE